MIKKCNNCDNAETEVTEIEQESFAMELLKDYSKQTKRWFVACMVVLVMWLSTIAGFIWYLYQYDYSSYEVTQDGEWGNTFIDGGNQGDINYGAENNNPEETAEESQD